MSFAGRWLLFSALQINANELLFGAEKIANSFHHDLIEATRSVSASTTGQSKKDISNVTNF